ncbi:MAG TPA: hypothetical protein PK228_20730 [Saprospiraceae bacterium]|nr:hypothetical protein [Saprospiraceae bacterium]
MEDKVLSYEEIKALFPNEWVLLALTGADALPAKSGVVLLHGKDYLEICYKASEVVKDRLTTIFFTGEQQKNRKWMKVSRLTEKPQTT